MHIPDGLLPPLAIASGYAVTAGMTWLSLRHIRQQDNPQLHIPRTALLTASFFVASWVHLPIPPTSVHLILNGLLGVLLGWYAFPAIVVGLFLQAVIFQHGGLTTLGVNASMMGIPALVGFALFQWRAWWGWTGHTVTLIFAFLGGASGLLLATLIAYGILVTSIPAYVDAALEQSAIAALMLAHVPLALIEGSLTAFIVAYLWRVSPDMLPGQPANRHVSSA